MKLISTLIIATLLISCRSNMDKTALADVTEDKKKLEASIRDFNQAFKVADVDALDSMITADYTHTNGSWAPIDKEQWLGYLKKRRESIASGELAVVNYRMEDLEIKMLGSTAIVTGRITTTMRSTDSEETKSYRVTHVWTKDNGRWLRAGFHDTPIPMAEDQ